MGNIYKLLSWIDLDDICWKRLSENPNAIYLLEQNQNKINWVFLSRNLKAIYLLEEYSHVTPHHIPCWHYTAFRI